MRYSEVDNISKGQVLEDTLIRSNTKADSLIHTITVYKIFYVFIIGSIFGCYMEQIQYYLIKGIWECRAGVVWGPFSEIYGLGAVILYLLYQIVKDKSPLTIFFLSATSGAAFEYIARVFQEIVFHSITWDYSKEPFNLGGRTSLKYAICWGLLGLVFIKGIYPVLDHAMERIKGKVAYTCTWVLIVFMLVNMAFSAVAVYRWSERLQGDQPEGYIEEYLDTNYHDEYMKHRFPHMRFMDVTMKIS